ncbi:MAG: acyl-CoA reductase [Crenarchaeota archaeon]|nr:acyl-CoA reductase [Thermoproteota archaeon]
MNREERILAFCKLGTLLTNAYNSRESELQAAIQKASFQNPWFTENNSLQAFRGITHMLAEHKLRSWLQSYSFPEKAHSRIAVIMAGNIPMVGFHDALCVLISGNTLIAKLSSKDTVLLEYVFSKLIEIDERFANHIQICTHTLPEFDAIICTGSNNSSRYFEYYFGKYPHIIRKNRNSVGVICEHDTAETYSKISHDIFSYFGLGCRNVSKLYIPESVDIRTILNSFKPDKSLVEHTKYMNNYEYQKSIYLVGQQEHLDTGYLLVAQSTQLYSPLAVLVYEPYTNILDVQQTLETHKDSIQCIVCSENLFYKENTIPGTTQVPELYNYADDIDTLSFILNLPV